MHPAGKWRRMLRGPSMDNAFASLRTRWKRHGETCLGGDNSANSVKWRRYQRVTQFSLQCSMILSFQIN